MLRPPFVFLEAFRDSSTTRFLARQAGVTGLQEKKRGSSTEQADGWTPAEIAEHAAAIAVVRGWPGWVPGEPYRPPPWPYCRPPGMPPMMPAPDDTILRFGQILAGKGTAAKPAPQPAPSGGTIGPAAKATTAASSSSGAAARPLPSATPPWLPPGTQGAHFPPRHHTPRPIGAPPPRGRSRSGYAQAGRQDDDVIWAPPVKQAPYPYGPKLPASAPPAKAKPPQSKPTQGTPKQEAPKKPSPWWRPGMPGSGWM